jgi:hypothetical protein
MGWLKFVDIPRSLNALPYEPWSYLPPTSYLLHPTSYILPHPTTYTTDPSSKGMRPTSYHILQLTLQIHRQKVWGLHPTTSYNWHNRSIIKRYDVYIRPHPTTDTTDPSSKVMMSTSYRILQLTLQIHHQKVWGLHPTTSYNWHNRSIFKRYEVYIIQRRTTDTTDPSSKGMRSTSYNVVQLTLQIHRQKVWGLHHTTSYNWHYRSIVKRYGVYIIQRRTTDTTDPSSKGTRSTSYNVLQLT